MTDKRKPRTAVLVPEHLEEFVPFSDNQAKAHKHWKKGKNLVLSGSPGTGKTFLALSFALKEVLPKNSEYEKVIIIRSIVPTREIGFLPGDEDEKKDEQDEKDDKTEENAAAHHEHGKAFDHAAGRVRAFMALSDDQFRGRDIQRQA